MTHSPVTRLLTFAIVLLLSACTSGTTGPAGAKGPTGAQGPAGAQGPTGAQGPAGTGATGETGGTGATGPTGSSGATGTSGATGATGAGTAGAMGTTGITGATGATGLTWQGPYTPGGGQTEQGNGYVVGDAVSEGGSSYVALVNNPQEDPLTSVITNGGDGEWALLALAGVAGATGSTGQAGVTGSTGLAGSTGATGATGDSGATGATGATGSDGTNGTAGATGSNGTNGATGATGPTGAPGPDGSAGVAGATGPTGATGFVTLPFSQTITNPGAALSVTNTSGSSWGTSSSGVTYSGGGAIAGIDASSAGFDGVSGTSTNGFGVEGTSAANSGVLGVTDLNDFALSLPAIICTPDAPPLCITQTPAQDLAQFFANRPDGVLGLDGTFNNNGVAVEGDTVNNVAVLGQVLIPSNNPTAVSAMFIGGGAGDGTCEYNGGSSGWSCSSSADARQVEQHSDLGNLLERLDKLPVDIYQEKHSARPIRNIGPTAEAFRAAFGFGGSDRMLDSGNVEGVALAAAKGLYEKVKQDEAEMADLKRQLAQQKVALEKLTALQASMARLERNVRRSSTDRPVAMASVAGP